MAGPEVQPRRPGLRLAACLSFVLFVAVGARADVDGRQLLKFAQEAEAVNAQREEANRYRAGFYYGYISGVLDALNGRSVCFSACRCELEALVDRHYAQHTEDLDKPAGPILAALFERHHPCRKP
jgi:hypothetical protein